MGSVGAQGFGIHQILSAHLLIGKLPADVFDYLFCALFLHLILIKDLRKHPVVHPDEGVSFLCRSIFFRHDIKAVLYLHENRFAPVLIMSVGIFYYGTEGSVLFLFRPFRAAPQNILDKIGVGIPGILYKVIDPVDIGSPVIKGRKEKAQIRGSHYPVPYPCAYAVFRLDITKPGL